MAGGRIVYFPVDGASGCSTQAGGPDPQIGVGRGPSKEDLQGIVADRKNYNVDLGTTSTICLPVHP